ncbi:ABC transporter substrate-binding protein [Methylibium sp.]|uniref:ABC transporter substrate-binding protein n=1 Tax=Methylibium sp. TaxID=2067992 RepID=UPI003D0E65E1
MRSGGLVLLFALGLHAAAVAQIVLRDDRGVTLTLAVPPQRIVTLLPSLTESVCALGGCARLVGTDRFSNWPAGVAALPKLGGLEDAQLETIVALKPDIVLLTPSDRVIERLESLGVRLAVLEARDHAGVQRTLQTLARLLGTPDADAPVWSRIERQLADAATRVPVALRGRRVYFEVDATPYAAGSGSFIGETLLRLGLGNIVPPALGPFPRLNPEYVLRAQPDIVMALQRNLAEMPGRPGWASLQALQRHQTCGFASAPYDVLVRPGPRMGEAALLLADCLAALPASAASAKPGAGR